MTAPPMPSADVPPLFDRALVRRRLARARAAGYADFLLARAMDDLDDRLGAVLRTFPLALDLGAPAPGLGARLTAAGRAERVIRLSATPEPGAVLGEPEWLPFAGGFDLVVSLLALQAANDLTGALVQARRALKPDGLFVACLLGGRTLTELRQSFAEAEAALEGGVSPRVAPTGDVRDLGGLLQRAGFALPVVDTETVTVRYADPFGLMRDLRAMGLTNALSERSRRPLRRATLVAAAEAYARRFADPDGRVRASFELIWLSGWAPAPGQQKPLKPGSATARLADALNTVEQPLRRDDP
jgi:SAM-dependent methyltransferase